MDRGDFRKIFLIEDDEDIGFAVKEALSSKGFEVYHFLRATEFFRAVEKEKPDLVIIDIMLPDFDGFRIARFLRNRPDLSEIPIIFLTAKISEEDKLRGFELGADDYITKPFSVKELIARVNAILRRVNKDKNSKVFKIDNLEIDTEKVKVTVDGKEIKLTPSEFKILKFLIENYGKPVSREKLIEKIWGYDHDAYDRTVDVHIKHLRDKLGKYSKYIKTVRGFGYKFDLT